MNTIGGSTNRMDLLAEIMRHKDRLDELLQVLPTETKSERKRKRQAHLALYRIGQMRITYQRGTTWEQRYALANQALEDARLSTARYAYGRAAIVKAKLELEGFQPEKARETLSFTARFTETGAPDIHPWVLAILAQAEMKLGYLDEPLQHLQAAREWAPQAQEKGALEVYVLCGQARLMNLMGLDSEQSALVRQAKTLAERLPPSSSFSQDALRTVHAREVNLELLRGRYAKVIGLVDGWLADDALYAGRSQHRGARLAVRAAALAMMAIEDPSKRQSAGTALEDALQEELSFPDRVRTHTRLAQVRRLQGKLDEASLELETARRLIQEWKGVQAPKRILAFEAHLCTEEARTAMSSGDAVELARIQPRLQESIAEQLAYWSDKAPRQGGLGLLQFRTRRSWFACLIDVEIALHSDEGVEAALGELLRMQASGSLARSMNAGPGSLTDIRRDLIVDEGCLLIYLPSDERSHVFAITQDDLVHAALPGESRLFALRAQHAGAVRRVLQAVRSGKKTSSAVREERALAKQLAQALIPEEIAAHVASSSALTVVGAELFDSLPYELLPFRSSEALGFERAIDYLPSIPLGLAMHARAQAAHETSLDVLLLANAEPAEDVLERWPESAALSLEADRCEEALNPYAEEDRQVRIGTSACPSVLSTSTPRLLQFLLHSVQDRDRERPALLVLSPEEGSSGLVSCDDVERLRAPPVVLLTACSTARGPRRRGDEATGNMGGAWLAAGSRTVLLSDRELWLDEALRLSDVLHERLKEHGDSPAEALRRARVALHKEGTFSTIAETAALRVLGLGQRPVFDVER